MKMLLMMTVMLIKIMISMKLKMNVNATMATNMKMMLSKVVVDPSILVRMYSKQTSCSYYRASVAVGQHAVGFTWTPKVCRIIAFCRYLGRYLSYSWGV